MLYSLQYNDVPQSWKKILRIIFTPRNSLFIIFVYENREIYFKIMYKTNISSFKY